MKGRYWTGLLGALVVLMISACANLFLPIIGGLLALLVTVIGGALVGYAVTRVDEEVKANPATATNAGAVAGLIMGLGAAAGVIIGALLLGALLAMSTEFFGPEFEQTWRRMLQDMEGYEAWMSGTSFDSVMGLVTTVSVMFGLCLGVMGVALTTGAAALTARLAAPSAPPARNGSLPAWGQTPSAPAQPPPSSSEPDDSEGSG